MVLSGPVGDDWVGLTDGVIAVDRALGFVQTPRCGAISLFLGTVRDHAPGRPGVDLVEYEAWEDKVEDSLREIVVGARHQWPSIVRVALWHRCGALVVGEVSVLVAVASPHRAEAFESARWCIDTLKETVPIWKHERWEGGEDWGVDARPISSPPGQWPVKLDGTTPRTPS